MKQIEKDSCGNIFGVEEYLARRQKIRKEEIKKEQDKYPEPFSYYSSFFLLTL